MIKTISGILSAVFLLLPSPLLSADRMNGPYPPPSSSSATSAYQTSTSKWVLKGLIRFYSSVISPADGPRSPSYPTGSAYGLDAIEQYGFFPGMILIADRLLHEADVPQGPIIMVYNKRRYYDPVRYNTYWWDHAVLNDRSR